MTSLVLVVITSNIAIVSASNVVNSKASASLNNIEGLSCRPGSIVELLAV